MPEIELEIKRESDSIYSGLKLTAYVNGKIAGYYGFAEARWPFLKGWYYSSLRVNENFRNKGIGKALVNAAVNKYLPELAKEKRRAITHFVGVLAEGEIKPKLKKQFLSLGYDPKRLLPIKALFKITKRLRPNLHPSHPSERLELPEYLVRKYPLTLKT